MEDDIKNIQRNLTEIRNTADSSKASPENLPQIEMQASEEESIEIAQMAIDIMRPHSEEKQKEIEKQEVVEEEQEATELKEWLDKIDLGVYYEPFLQNGFGKQVSVLSDLTDEDLREIGVTLMGHRKLIMREAKLFSKAKSDGDHSKENTLTIPTGLHPIMQSTATSMASAEMEGMYIDFRHSEISQGIEGNQTTGNEMAAGPELGYVEEERSDHSDLDMQ